MSAATFIALRVNNAEQFKESVSEPSPNTRIYLTYGRVEPWTNEAAPDTANTSIATVYDIWSNMVGGKKITGNDIRHIIPRFNWTSNTKYIAYDDQNPNLWDKNTKFYVVTSDYNVYKCLSNNYSSNSTVEPTSVNQSTTTSTGDGYVWKYMYTLSDQDLLRYTTDDYIPVKTLSGSDGSTQWAVQTNATKGAINSIIVTNGGSGYTNANSVIVSVSGDGTGLTAIATLNLTAQTVSNITISNPGQDYSTATITISGGEGTGATARAIISPPGGHGHDPLYELGGSSIMINGRLINSEGSVLPTVNEFRQIALLKDPYKLDTTTIMANNAFLQAYKIPVVGSGDYIQDEIVYQGASLATFTFYARVLHWDSANNIVYVTNHTGTPTGGIALIGSGTSSRFVSTPVIPGELDKYTGDILYVDNIKAITRDPDQTEEFKIIINF